ncbi:MAG: hypothetical protein ICCCNLDF_02743 [Planctomycetes bacterium]|nr:hypothetical protein [Planctomycetota bacterium]
MAQVFALVTCDTAVLSRGMWTLVNAFDELFFDEFPAVHPGFDVMVGLKDLRGVGATDIDLELVDFRMELDDAANAVVWYDMVEIAAAPPLRREWIRFRTKDVRFPHPGIYEIRVLENGEIIETGAIRVRQS